MKVQRRSCCVPSSRSKTFSRFADLSTGRNRQEHGSPIMTRTENFHGRMPIRFTAVVVWALIGWGFGTPLAHSKNPAAQSHKGVFYENDFSYLLTGEQDLYLGDGFKRLCAGQWIVYDVGGQFRLRHHSERNHRGLGLTGRDDDFLLYRTRLYVNAEVGEVFRAYAEMIDAVSNYETFAPRPIEENRADFLNLFGDVKLWDTGTGRLWARLGRQELIHGNQRVVSPLDWANTRRTFEGYKLFWRGDEWNLDAFWVRPMRIDVHNFDSPDYDQQFLGIYATRHVCKNQILDLYYLRLDDDRQGFEFDTLGLRLLSQSDPWMLEVEGAVQVGNYRGVDHRAGTWTVGFGRKFATLPWSPVVWVYYDWASGAAQQGNGYHHLFPLAHKYMGFMDLFGRRNIETPNVQLVLSPHKQLKLMAWYYVFYLEDPNDVPYTVVMTPFNGANAPADPYLGQELDLTATWAFNPRTKLLFGYSHFFAGDYYDRTPGLAYRGDADFFYTQFLLNF